MFSSLFLLCFSIYSLLSEASLPKFLTHLTRPLSHCTGAGFWIFEVGGWIGMDWQAGFGSLDWDRLMVGLDRWVWNSGSVNWWMDRLGWSSVTPVMIFGYFRRPRFQIGGVDLLIGDLGGGCGGRCWLQLVWWFVCVCGSVDGLCVWLCWWFVFVCVWLCVCGDGFG